MRTKKATINAVINMASFILTLIPNMIVRKVFLDSLGSDMLGLTSLYTNIISWLSIVDLGVGSAIIYSLYKPFANNNYREVNGYIKFYGWFYRSIGVLILLLGLVGTLFLHFFIKTNIDMRIAKVGFILFLINTIISYLFSHKLCILNVSQQAYKVTLGSNISKMIIAIMQVIMLKTNPSFILFISIQILINLMYFICINIYVSKIYPWLNDKSDSLKEYEKKELLKNVRAMFMHKIGGLIVYATDNIVISKYIGLTSLSNYSNYQMVISALQSMIGTGLNGITASIGNLIVEESREKIYEIYKNLFFINFWITSIMITSLYNTLNQFVGIWVGKEYFIDEFTFIVLMINVYFSSMRGPVEQFQSASGKFHQDRYGPICEALINLVSSIVLVNIIGLPGIFIGTLLSNFAVIFWTKPYVVYKYVFHRSVKEYFVTYLKKSLIVVGSIIITHFVTTPFKYQYTIKAFIINCILNIVIMSLINLLIFYKTSEFKYIISLTRKVIYNGNFKINKKGE